VTNACPANAPELTALPALNPSHPNQNNAVPSIMNGVFGVGEVNDEYSERGPKNMAPASAAYPDAISTGIPPAKSI